MSYTIENRLALVTGAGRGLGAAVAAVLAQEGARVLATDLDGGAAELRAASIAERGGWCRARRLDVTDAEAVAEMAREVERQHGPLDVLVNNAGIVFGGAFLDVPLDHHLTTYRVNTEGLVIMSHAFLPQLLAGESGRLVNIASASGFIGLPWATTYASSKWSVIGFSESLRMELAELGQRDLRVIAVCPGYIATGLFSGVRPPRLTRVMTPEDVARRVVRAIRRGERRVLIPSLTRLGPINVALPAWLSDRLSHLLGVTLSMKGWRGHTAAGSRGDDDATGDL